jgi:hypothetical protein
MGQNPAVARQQPTVGRHTVPVEQRRSGWAYARTTKAMRKAEHDMGLPAPQRMLHVLAGQAPLQPKVERHTVPGEQRVSARACARTMKRMRNGEHGTALLAPPIGLCSHRDKRKQHPDQELRGVFPQDGYPEKTTHRGYSPQSGEHGTAFRRQRKTRERFRLCRMAD